MKTRLLLLFYINNCFSGGSCSKPSIVEPINPEQVLVMQQPIIHNPHQSIHTRLDSTDQQEQNRVLAIHIPIPAVESKVATIVPVVTANARLRSYTSSQQPGN